MAKQRSPNYPSLTLEQAIEKARQVYDSEHTHPAPREVVAQALGYGGLNGRALTVIGAIAAYGLLEKAGTGSLKISPDAVSVFELVEGQSERNEALMRLAFNPKLFEELNDKFGDEPPSDVNLKHFLIQEKQFLPKAASDVIRVYRANLELVTNETPAYAKADQAETGTKSMTNVTSWKSSDEATVHRGSRGEPMLAVTKSLHEFSFPLSLQRDIKATITISGSSELRRRDLEFLKRKVGDLLEGFEEEPTEPRTTAPEDDLESKD